MKALRLITIRLWYNAFFNDSKFDKRIFELIESFFEAMDNYFNMLMCENTNP